MSPPAFLAIALALVPSLTDDFRAYQIGLFLLYGIAAQGIALAWGSAGILPLGQSLFFGVGAYLSGGILKAAAVHAQWWFAWPLAAVVPALAAYLVARMVFARQVELGPSLFFSLITLALVMLGYQVANQWRDVTGGFNGLGDIPELPGLDRFGRMYWLVAAVTLAVTTVLHWLNRTPLGTLFRALADNENRLQFFGFATARIKALAFAASAFLAALGGALYAPQQGLVTPSTIDVSLATQLVVWVAVGGRASPYGSLVGAVGIGLLSSELRDRYSFWEALVAVVFIVVVLRFPIGVWGAIVQAVTRRVRRGRPPNIELPGAGSPLAPPPHHLAQAAGQPAAEAVLEFDEVHAGANGVRILDGLTLRVEGCGIHCVIGPNGAGKTSTFNALTGRLPISSGRVRLFGRAIARFDPVALARAGVGRKFQVPSVFPTLSVQDNLLVATWANRTRGFDLLRMRLRRWTTPASLALVQQLPFLAAEAGRPARELSQGQRQMLELAMSLIPEPLLLLLDEPCAGLSPDETRRQIEVATATVRRFGATALVIEHDLTAVERMAERVHVLHQGRSLRSGTLAEVQSDPAVQAVYAGGRK